MYLKVNNYTVTNKNCDIEQVSGQCRTSSYINLNDNSVGQDVTEFGSEFH